MSILFISIFISLFLVTIALLYLAWTTISETTFASFMIFLITTLLCGVYGLFSVLPIDVSYTDAVVELKGNSLVITDQRDTILETDVKFLNNPTSLMRYKNQNKLALRAMKLSNQC